MFDMDRLLMYLHRSLVNSYKSHKTDIKYLMSISSFKDDAREVFLLVSTSVKCPLDSIVSRLECLGSPVPDVAIRLQN